jgi:Adenylate and Guanylate cyclase catalytic domain
MAPRTQYTKSGDASIAYQVLGDGPIDLVYAQGWITNVEYAWENPDQTDEQYEETWVTKLESEWGGPFDLEHGAPSVATDEAARSWFGAYLRYSASLSAAKERSCIKITRWMSAIYCRRSGRRPWCSIVPAISGCRSLTADISPSMGLDVRVGLHTGECERRGNDLSGLAVHLASRISSKAPPTGILVSSTVKDLVVGSGITFADQGMHSLKGIPGEWSLWSVLQ